MPLTGASWNWPSFPSGEVFDVSSGNCSTGRKKRQRKNTRTNKTREACHKNEEKVAKALAVASCDEAVAESCAVVPGAAAAADVARAQVEGVPDRGGVWDLCFNPLRGDNLLR